MNSRCILLVLCIFLAHSVEGAFVLKNGSFKDVKTLATLPAQEHYDLGMQAIQDCHWAEAQKQFSIVTTAFPRTDLGQESYFYLGLAEFKQNELDFANEAFSNYLKSKNNPKFFQDAIMYKYEIAGQLANGSKRRFLGSKRMPKWATGRTLALKIYDEVIAALPSNDLAARALFQKGKLHLQMRDYRPAIENYQLVIRRFPKHELVPEAYLAISKIYLEECQYELQNPDLLTFAEINLRKFRLDFPRDERIKEVENDLAEMTEIYAQSLYETGKFYERIGKPHASTIYYQSTIKKFPNAEISQQASQNLDNLKQNK